MEMVNWLLKIQHLTSSAIFSGSAKTDRHIIVPETALQIISGTTAVSDTHLDVYKRQHLRRLPTL